MFARRRDLLLAIGSISLLLCLSKSSDVLSNLGDSSLGLEESRLEGGLSLIEYADASGCRLASVPKAGDGITLMVDIA